MATVLERKPGVWEVRAFTGRDERGRPTQVSRTVRGTKKDALRVAAELTVRPSPGPPAQEILQRIDGRWDVIDDEIVLVDYNRMPVRYDDDFNCVTQCSEIEALAQQGAQGGWTCIFVDCTSAAERERAIVQNAIAAQGIFTPEGDLRGEFLAQQAYVDCIQGHADPTACGVDAVSPGDVDLDAPEDPTTNTSSTSPGSRPRPRPRQRPLRTPPALPRRHHQRRRIPRPRRPTTWSAPAECDDPV